MSVKNRLKEFITCHGLTTSAFEKSIGASNGYVNSITKGIGGDKLLLLLEKYPKINIEWLLIGKGKMLKEKENENTNYKELAESRKKNVDLLERENERLTRENKELKKAKKPQNYFRGAAEPDP